MTTATSLIAGLLCSLLYSYCTAEDGRGSAVQAGEAAAKRATPADPHSFGNPEQVQVQQIELDLTVDFDRRQIHGVVILDIRRQDGCPENAPLVLDTRALTIEKVSLRRLVLHTAEQFQPTKYQLAPADPILGSKLTIELTPAATQVLIEYRTSPEATALQWLAPALTAGKVKPFLFSQSQAIHARSWIPLQDSPGVRLTYSAAIRVPLGLKAVMAAESRLHPDHVKVGVFHFRMPQPIPPYLIALAVGDLTFHSLGRRTGVWAEPSVIKLAAAEFADVEAMVAACEKDFGPYRWGRYDILVLPPSFPFGGMENPRLTFATPTIMAGDRSLVSLIAHELAHSWSGNLVTNATWRDFWLNEGMTTYIERRIVESLYGRRRAEMEAVLGMAELRDELGRLPKKDQILHIDLTGRDPDDGMTRVPYEKGALLLRNLEQLVGRERFDAFLREYFDSHRFQSITTEEFESFLRDKLLGYEPDSTKTFDLATWLERPGLPKSITEPQSSQLDKIDGAASSWQSGKVATDKLNAADWSTPEWLRFLERMPGTLSLDRMTDLDRMFHLTDSGNAEIAHRWLLLAIRSHYSPADMRLESYLNTIGRRKLVLPLYRALAESPDGLRRARAIYAKSRPSYHPITVDSIDRLLNTSSDGTKKT
jgi:leukotriene-A4 hydrolase